MQILSVVCNYIYIFFFQIYYCYKMTTSKLNKINMKLLYQYNDLQIHYIYQENLYKIQRKNMYIKAKFYIFETFFAMLNCVDDEAVKTELMIPPYTKFEIFKLSSEVSISFIGYNNSLISVISLLKADIDNLLSVIPRIRDFDTKLRKTKSAIMNNNKRKYNSNNQSSNVANKNITKQENLQQHQQQGVDQNQQDHNIATSNVQEHKNSESTDPRKRKYAKKSEDLNEMELLQLLGEPIQDNFLCKSENVTIENTITI